MERARVQGTERGERCVHMRSGGDLLGVYACDSLQKRAFLCMYDCAPIAVCQDLGEVDGSREVIESSQSSRGWVFLQSFLALRCSGKVLIFWLKIY